MTLFTRRKLLKAGAAGAIALTLQPKSVLASAWPRRPITIVIQYGAGGGTDTIVRALGKALEKSFTVGVRAVNQPGAGGALAAEAVLGRKPDGYWLLGGVDYNKFFRVMGYAQTAPWKDWQFIKVGSALPAWAVTPKSPFKTMADVIKAAKSDPRSVRISNAGIGGVWHEASLLALEQSTGARFTHVPYGGGAPAAVAVLQGEVDVVANGVHEQVEYLRTGKLRSLGVYLTKPLAVDGLDDPLPAITESVPTAADLGVLHAVFCIGIRRNAEPEIIRTLSDALKQAVSDEGFNSVLGKKMIFPEFMTGSDADRDAARMESITSWLYHDIKMAGAKHNPKELGIPRPEDFNSYWPPRDYSSLL